MAESTRERIAYGPQKLAQAARIGALYQQGLNLHEIKEILSVSYGYVQKIVDNANLARNSGPRIRLDAKPCVLRMHQMGISTSQIALALGISKNTVITYIREANLRI